MRNECSARERGVPSRTTGNCARSMALALLLVACQCGVAEASRLAMRGRCGPGQVHMSDPLAGADPEQVRMMEERVILVDRDDRVLGDESKVNSHLNEYGPMLHRAFSVFLFDEADRLLLQRRALSKVTFPGYWTNTCCSHPLHVPDELGETDDGPLDGAVRGTARAAIRKLEQELGIPTTTLTVDDLHFLTRIHYLARARTDNPAMERSEFGEHEVDYLYVARVPGVASLLAPNANEVCDTRFVKPEELRELIAASHGGDVRITPWFSLIADAFLFTWWGHVGNVGELLAHQNCDTIHRLGAEVEEYLREEDRRSGGTM